jgi:hypothetical protein
MTQLVPSQFGKSSMQITSCNSLIFFPRNELKRQTMRYIERAKDMHN